MRQALREIFWVPPGAQTMIELPDGSVLFVDYALPPDAPPSTPPVEASWTYRPHRRTR